MKWLLSLLLVTGIGSDTISENFGTIGKRNIQSQSEVIPPEPPQAKYQFDSQSVGLITTAGSDVSAWFNAGTVAMSMDQATLSNRPLSIVSGSDSGIWFDGTNDSLSRINMTRSDNWHIFLVATVDLVDTDFSCGNNDFIFGDINYHSIQLRTSAGIIYAVAFNNDGTNDCAEVAITLNIDGRVLIDAKNTGTEVSIAFNGGAFTSTASGNTTNLPVTMGMGGVSARFFDGAIHEVYEYDNDLDSVDRQIVLDYLQWKWNI
jgi:hypothetical protein